MSEYILLTNRIKEGFRRLVAPIGNFLVRLGIHPNILSFAGLLFSLIAGLIYSAGYFIWGACVVILAGICDILDGQIARQTGKDSLYGAYIDSCLDRFGELFIFLGLAWYFSALHPSPLTILFIIMAIAGSFMVSYTRARAEGLGVDCKLGWMQRPERIVFLIIGSLLACLPVIGIILMKATLLLLAILSNLTAIQRIIYVRNQQTL